MSRGSLLCDTHWMQSCKQKALTQEGLALGAEVKHDFLMITSLPLPFLFFAAIMKFDTQPHEWIAHVLKSKAKWPLVHKIVS